MALSANPASIGSYRVRTLAPVKMENACFYTFICKKCGHKKSIKGRKSIGHKAGYKCADCATKEKK